ncbi:MAG TPA: amidohydrolase, partial [Sulfurovum sp.]|nr:amidohydrolase [Sulfurovum sp.]
GKMVKIDLKGKTMMPGFIEPHLHPSIAAIMLLNDTIAPHDVSKAAKTPQEYQKLLKVSIDNNAKEGEMHFIWGYHQL